MKIALLFFLISLNYIYSVEKQSCTNPLNSNLNPFLTKDFIKYPINGPQTDFCANLENKQSCCNTKMTEQAYDHFEEFQEDFHEKNYKTIEIFDNNIREILLNQQTALDSVDAYNQALDNIDTTQSFLEAVRDGLPTVPEGENSFDIQGDELSIEVDGTEYSINGEELNEYFNGNSEQIRDSIDAVDTALKQLVDLEMFKDAKFIIREKNGDHYSIRIDKDLLQKDFTEAQIRLRKHVQAREKCFTTLNKHFGATRCLGCEFKWEDIGIELVLASGAYIYLNMKRDMCFTLMEECFDFMDTSREMNANAALYVFVVSAQGMVDNGTLPEVGDFDSVDEANEEIAFLTAMNAEFLMHIPDTQFFIIDSDCVSNSECIYVCQKFIDSMGVDLEVIFGEIIEENGENLLDNVLDDIEDAQDEDNGSRRILYEDNGFQDADTIKYRNNNPLDTIVYAEGINGNFTFEGDSGYDIFNSTGNATIDDLLTVNIGEGENKSDCSILYYNGFILIILLFVQFIL